MLEAWNESKNCKLNERIAKSFLLTNEFKVLLQRMDQMNDTHIYIILINKRNDNKQQWSNRKKRLNANFLANNRETSCFKFDWNIYDGKCRMLESRKSWELYLFEPKTIFIYWHPILLDWQPALNFEYLFNFHLCQ